MSIELYLAYVAAAAIVLVIPGPTIIFVITQAMALGRRSVVPLVLGVVFGDFTAMTLSLAGLGAILSASAALFAILKWIGAFYLIYLGLGLWRASRRPQVSPHAGNRPAPASFRRAYIVTALNPKGIAFFVAFLPHFVNPAADIMPQLLMLGATFLLLAGLNAALYAVFAGHLRDTLQHPGIRRWLDRAGGTALIGAGLFTAALRRTA